MGVSQPHLPPAHELIPADLEAAASPWLPAELPAWEVCGRRGDARAVGHAGPSSGHRRGVRVEGRGLESLTFSPKL